MAGARGAANFGHKCISVLECVFLNFLALYQGGRRPGQSRMPTIRVSPPNRRGRACRSDLGRLRMSGEPVRWMMTGRGEPLVQMKFDTLSPGPDEVLVESPAAASATPISATTTTACAPST